MGFKSVKSYNEDRFGGFFLLRNDGDSADVVFLYRSIDDVLTADVHYIKSPEYSGYVHCCGAGCPACAKGIRVQSKLFIPVYSITEDKILYFDRSMRFEPQLQRDVFQMYPDPCNYVFRITRHGAPNDVNTTYEIRAVGRNIPDTSYDAILNKFHTSMPEDYSRICRDMLASDMSRILSANSTSTAPGNADSLPDYTPTPRVPIAPANTGVPFSADGVSVIADASVGASEFASSDDGFENLEDLDEDPKF